MVLKNEGTLVLHEAHVTLNLQYVCDNMYVHANELFSRNNSKRNKLVPLYGTQVVVVILLPYKIPEVAKDLRCIHSIYTFQH